MKRSSNRSGKSTDSNQMMIDWPQAPCGAPVETPRQKLIPSHQTHLRRITSRLPVPKPLPQAIAAGHFGHDEHGRAICPGNYEIRAITERHAEKLIDLLENMQAVGSANPTEAERLGQAFDKAITDYAEDFGDSAARQLEAYIRRQVRLKDGPSR